MTHERNDGNVADKDEARTPPAFFRHVEKTLGVQFVVDAACSTANCLCEHGYTKECNSLIQDWAGLSQKAFLHKADGTKYSPDVPAVYCNMPYSNPAIWVEKAVAEAAKGAIVVLLMPADMSAGYVRKYILGVDMHGDIPVRNQYGASTILFTDGRMAFNNPDGSRKKGSPKFASMVVVFTSRFQQDGMYVGVISRVKEPRVKKTKAVGSGDLQ